MFKVKNFPDPDLFPTRPTLNFQEIPYFFKFHDQNNILVICSQIKLGYIGDLNFRKAIPIGPGLIIWSLIVGRGSNKRLDSRLIQL